MQAILHQFVRQSSQRAERVIPRPRDAEKKPVQPHSIRSSSGTAVVHLSYDMDNVPPRPYDPDKPGTRWTRFVCISDTHSVIDFPVPDGDILIHAGDLTTVGRVPDLQKTIQWLSRLPHAAKIVIAGSHDLVLDMDWYDQYSWKVHGKSLEDPLAARNLVRGPRVNAARLIYLEYQAARAQGFPCPPPPPSPIPSSPITTMLKKASAMVSNAVLSTESALASSSGSSTEVSSSSSFSSSIPKEWKLFGVPGTPESDPDRPGPSTGLAFHYAKGTDAEETFARVLPDTEILITHGPPANILDTSEEGTHVGCEELWKRVKAIRPRLHVFGHVHEGRGALIHTWGEEGDDDAEDVQENRCGSSETIFVNASSTPAGALYYEALNDGHSPDVGGYNFQPIIVDLLDDLPPALSPPSPPPIPSRSSSRLPSSSPEPAPPPLPTIPSPLTRLLSPSPTTPIISLKRLRSPSPAPSIPSDLPQTIRSSPKPFSRASSADPTLPTTGSGNGGKYRMNPATRERARSPQPPSRGSPVPRGRRSTPGPTRLLRASSRKKEPPKVKESE